MSFREEDRGYKILQDDWRGIVKRAYKPEMGLFVSELDSLMIASYRLMQYIRHYLSNGYRKEYRPNFVKVPFLRQAIEDAIEVVEQRSFLPGLFIEADRLEALSRAAYHYLKDSNKLHGEEGAQK